MRELTRSGAKFTAKCRIGDKFIANSDMIGKGFDIKTKMAYENGRNGGLEDSGEYCDCGNVEQGVNVCAKFYLMIITPMQMCTLLFLMQKYAGQIWSFCVQFTCSFWVQRVIQ